MRDILSQVRRWLRRYREIEDKVREQRKNEYGNFEEFHRQKMEERKSDEQDSGLLIYN